MSIFDFEIWTIDLKSKKSCKMLVFLEDELFFFLECVKNYVIYNLCWFNIQNIIPIIGEDRTVKPNKAWHANHLKLLGLPVLFLCETIS